MARAILNTPRVLRTGHPPHGDSDRQRGTRSLRPPGARQPWP